MRLNVFVLREGELGINGTKHALIDHHENFNIIEIKASKQAHQTYEWLVKY